jgi:hypothetical protein
LDIIKEQNKKKKITERAERDIPLIVFHDQREGVVIYVRDMIFLKNHVTHMALGPTIPSHAGSTSYFILFLPIFRFLCIYNAIYVMRQKSCIIACICILVF